MEHNRPFYKRLAVLLLGALPAFGQCTLTSPTTWNIAGNGNWSTSPDWNPMTVPNSSSTNVCITNGTSTVTLDSSRTIGSLQLAAGNTLGINNGQTLTVNGPSVINGGAISLNGTGTSTFINMTGDTTLSGGGTLTLSNSAHNGQTLIYSSVNNGRTLDNVDNLIQGEGHIGDTYNMVVKNEAGGTISANVNGQTLFLDSAGGIINQGTLQGINGGVLQVTYGLSNSGATVQALNGGAVNFNAAVNNSAGSISADGSSTIGLLQGGGIQGGTVTGTVHASGSNSFDGSTHGALNYTGNFTGANGDVTSISGAIVNNGTLTLAGTGSGTYFNMNGNTTLTGGGTITLANSAHNGATLIYSSVNNGRTLDNVDNLIQGEGHVGDTYNMILKNEAGGTVVANLNGQTLILDSAGGVINAGVMKATGGGNLQLTSIVNNLGGTISTDNNPASKVTLASGTVIQGGTLNGNVVAPGSAFLDGTTNGTLHNLGSITLGNGGSAMVFGSLDNTGSLTMNGAGSGTYLNVTGDTTLTGGGTVTLANSAHNGATLIYSSPSNGRTLDNVNNTIQGEGHIGDTYNMVLKNEAGGTINANVSGHTLFVDPAGGTSNLGLMEAANGGTLDLSYSVNNSGHTIQALNGSTLAFHGAVNNGGGMITADGTSGLVLASGANIQGGTLTGNAQASGAFTLDGVTHGALSYTGNLTMANGGSMSLLGSVANNGTMTLNGAGSGTYINVTSDSTLTGGGTITLANSAHNGATLIYSSVSNGRTLDNVNNLIQGEGHIGDTYNMVVKNEAGGVISANQNGQTLFLDAAGGIVNQGTLQGINGGVLQVNYGLNNSGATVSAMNEGAVQFAAAVNNSGGTISADGSSTIGLLSGGQVQGGTLSGTVHASGANALDGSTHGALSYTGNFIGANGDNTAILGAIANHGTITLNGTGNGTYINVTGDTTLTGGGTITLANSAHNGNTLIYSGPDNGRTLTNVDNLIQGEGHIGNTYNMRVINGGTILANVNGQTLIIDSAGGLTNTGTLEVAAGSTLHGQYGFTNYSGNTLTGGKYVINGPGTLQIDALGTSGGEIHTNNAFIVLNGAGSNFVDLSGKDALSNLNNNEGELVVEGGRNFATPASDFSNSGGVEVGAGSTFTDATHTYLQTAGITQVDGTLVTPLVDVMGGIVSGTGTINGTVKNEAGTFSPGDNPGAPHDPPGTETINGDYLQLGPALFNETIGGSGHGESSLASVNGNVTLGSAGNQLSNLEVSLLNGFEPATSETFVFLSYLGNLVGTFDLLNPHVDPLGAFSLRYDTHDVALVFTPNASAVPEPAEFLPIALLLAAAVIYQRKRKNRKTA